MALSTGIRFTCCVRIYAGGALDQVAATAEGAACAASGPASTDGSSGSSCSGGGRRRQRRRQEMTLLTRPTVLLPPAAQPVWPTAGLVSPFGPCGGPISVPFGDMSLRSALRGPVSSFGPSEDQSHCVRWTRHFSARAVDPSHVNVHVSLFSPSAVLTRRMGLGMLVRLYIAFSQLYIYTRAHFVSSDSCAYGLWTVICAKMTIHLSLEAHCFHDSR